MAGARPRAGDPGQRVGPFHLVRHRVLVEHFPPQLGHRFQPPRGDDDLVRGNAVGEQTADAAGDQPGFADRPGGFDPVQPGTVRGRFR